jgi:cell division protein FtsN
MGALVFFALYYIGNRMSVGDDRPQNAAASQPQPETQSIAPETQSAAPTTTVPDKAENSARSSQPAESVAAVAARDEKPKPVEKPAAEALKRESKPEPKPSVTVATPVVTAPVAPAAVQGTGNFTVQVGSYNVAAQADERASQLRSSGVEARVVRAEIPHRGTWYRVQTGRFSSHTDAARYAAELKGKGAASDFIITEIQGQ